MYIMFGGAAVALITFPLPCARHYKPRLVYFLPKYGDDKYATIGLVQHTSLSADFRFLSILEQGPLLLDQM